MIELSKKFVCVHLEMGGENKDLADQLGVHQLPDVQIISAKGDTLEHFRGGVSTDDLTKAMEGALAKR